MNIETEITQNPLGTDPISKLVLKYSIPCAISLVVNAFYNIVDQIFVGHGVGYLGNAATNVIYPLTEYILEVGSNLGDGCAANLSLELGKGKKENASRNVCNTIAVMLFVGILLGILSALFLEPLCHLLGATEQNLPYALEYGRLIVIGIPFSVIDITLNSIVRADGSPRYCMIGLFIGCGTNLILDPIFILGLGMGMTGAALATILGQIFNAVFLLVYIPRFKTVALKKNYFRINLRIIRKTLTLGISSFVLQLSIVLLVTVTNNVLVKFGSLSKYGPDIPLAAMGIAMKVNMIVINIVQGIATGAQPIIGYNYGAGLYQRTKQTFKTVVIASVVTMAAAFIVFEFFPMSIVRLFGSESELYNEFAVKCFRIYLCMCILNGFQMSTVFFFQAVGKPFLSTINTLVKQVIVVIPMFVLLGFLAGVEGVLWAGPVADIAAFLTAVVLLKRYWGRIFA